MNKPTSPDLKQLADQLRAKSPWNLDLFSLVRAAQEQNITFDLEQLRQPDKEVMAGLALLVLMNSQGATA